MRTVSFDELRLAGMLDADRTATGLVPRRLPAWTRPQLTDVQLALMVTMPAGVRLELETDAREIELDVHLTMVKMGDRPVKPAAFDLVVDGEVSASASTVDGTHILYDPRTGGVDFAPGEPTTIRLPGPGARSIVELWLPQDCVVELRALRVDDGAAVGPVTRIRRRWIHHGSSISHCFEALSPTGTWPAIVALRADVDLQSLAFAGQCMLDQFTARTIRDLPADIISVKAGINVVNGDTMRERTYGAALHGFLDTIRDGHPTTPLILATPIICPAVETAPGPTVLGADGRFGAPARPAELATGALSLARIREIEADVVAARRAAGDEHLHLLDGLALFGAADVADLDDGLHPNAAGYRRMGERFHALAFTDGAPFAP